MHTFQTIAEQLHCAGIEKKVYTGDEIGKEASLLDRTSYIIYTEHPKLSGYIGGMFEIAAQEIGQYDLKMWDNRPLSEHVAGL